MLRTNIGSLTGVLAFALAFSSTGRALAQEAQPAPSTTPQSAQPASPIDATQPTSDPDKTVAPAADVKEAPASSAPQAKPATKGNKGKQEYTGPMTLVVLEPTPMLDEEGNQRQDPDGKLMFNPPVKQQRDKFGHPLFDAQGKPVMQTKDN